MKKISISILSASLLLFSACEEIEDLCGISQEDLGFTEDYTHHLNAAMYIYQQADRALRDSTLQATGTSEIDGATCTQTTDSIIVDFGAGTIGHDGKTRRGSYRMAYSGNYLTPGSTASLRLAGYAEGDRNYTGTVNLSNITSGATPTVAVNVGKLTAGDFELNGTVNAAWLSGFETASETMDDAFELSGALDLLNTSTSDTYNGQIINPLQIATACDYTFEGGQINLTTSLPEFSGLSIDFIDGDCANLFQANVDCSGNSISFYYPIQ